MTPARLTALVAVAAIAAGGATAAVITAGDGNDDGARTIAVTRTIQDPAPSSVAASLDDIIAKGDSVSFAYAERSPGERPSRVRGHVERDASGRITGVLDARP